MTHPMPDGNSAALRDYMREQDQPFDEDEAAEFWERHEKWSRDYWALRAPQPGALMVPPEDWEDECRA